MRRLQRKTLFSQDKSLEMRVEQLERRWNTDMPVHAGFMGGQTPVAVGAGTSELIGFDDPGDTFETVMGDFVIDSTGEWMMFPIGWEGVFMVYAAVAWNAGSSPADPTECRVFANLEVLELVAGTWTPGGGGVNSHAYREFNHYLNLGDPIWNMVFLHAANNGVEGQTDKRYGVSLNFLNATASSVTVTGLPVTVQLLEDNVALPSYG